MHRQLWRRLDRIRRACGRMPPRTKCGFRSMLWASASIDAVGIDYYAPLGDWRDTGDQLDRALTTRSTTRLSRRQSAPARPTTGTTPTMPRAARRRAARTATVSASHGFSARRIAGTGGRIRITSASAARTGDPDRLVPKAKPIWLTESAARGRQGRQPVEHISRSKSSEAGIAAFSNGERDDIIQRRLLEAVLGASIPRSAPPRSIRCRRSMAAGWSTGGHPSVDLGRAALSGVSGRHRCLERWRQLGDRALADRPARLGAARRPGDDYARR